MEFYDVVSKRRSYRKFKADQQPEEEKIKRIINAARLAPTWANKQGVEYIIVRDEEKVKKVWKAIGQRKKFRNAPMYIVGIISEEDSGTNPSGIKYYTVDFGICFEHLILAATAEGLATCWIGWFNEDKIKNLLTIPEKYRVLGLTPVGYSIRKKGPVEKRKPLEEIIHKEQF
ncbi:MAG: nitroreductase family protein [Promethearchaeia archaeon]